MFKISSSYQEFGDNAYIEIRKELAKNQYAKEDLQFICEKLDLLDYLDELSDRNVPFHELSENIFKRYSLKTNNYIDLNVLKQVFKAKPIFSDLVSILEEPNSIKVDSKDKSHHPVPALPKLPARNNSCQPPPLPSRSSSLRMKGPDDLTSTSGSSCVSSGSSSPSPPLLALPDADVFPILPKGAHSATQLLMDRQVGSFLVRLSESAKGQYALDVKTENEKVSHFHIRKLGKTFSIVELFSNTFNSLEELLTFLSDQEIHLMPLDHSLRVRPTQLNGWKPSTKRAQKHCPTCTCPSHKNMTETLREEIPRHNNKSVDRELARLLGLANEYETYLTTTCTPVAKSLHVDKLLHMWRDTRGDEATQENLLLILEGHTEFTAIVQRLAKAHQ